MTEDKYIQKNHKKFQWLRKMKWGDFLVVLITLLICVALWINLAMGYTRESNVCEILVKNEVVLRYNLLTTKNQYISEEIDQYLDHFEENRISSDELILHIESNGIHFDLLLTEGRIRFNQSDCPDRICVYTGFISKNGQIAACVPAGVLVRITGEDNPDDLDFIAG